MVFPYLNFHRECEEALKLYGRAFGEQNLLMRRYGEHAPDASMKDLVMHAEMDLGDIGHLSASDAAWSYDKGSAINIMIRATEEKLRKAWAVLSEEGVVLSELAPFAIENNSLMGTVTDKFGFTWIFTESAE